MSHQAAPASTSTDGGPAPRRRARSATARPLRALAVGLAAALALAACSSSGNASSGNASTSGTSASNGSSSTTSSGSESSAAKLVALAEAAPVYGPTTGTVQPAQLHTATAADIDAFAYKPLTNVKPVAVVVASKNAAGLDQMGNTVVAALAKLHIGAKQFYGDFTPAGAQTAMNSALASNPSAIVLITITPATITPQIATAKARKIPIIDGTASEAVDGGGLTAYVSESFNLVQILQAAYIVANGGPKAKSVWLTLPSFPTVESAAGLAYLKAVCPGCSTKQTEMTLAQESSPVAFGQLVTSVVRANPSAKYITTPAACIPLSAAHAAIKQAGSSAAFSSGGCTPTALGAVNAGYMPFMSMSSETWNGFSIVDQLLRVLSGAKPSVGTGPGVMLIDKQNAPTTSTTPTFGPIDRWLLKRFDFVAPYSKAWGVDLSSIIATEK